MSIVPVILLTAAAAAAPARVAPTAAPRCVVVDRAQIASLFDGWNLALASLDPDRVTQRYWSDAVLLPTVSNTPRTNAAMIHDYFEHFLEKHPRGRIDTRTIELGCNVAFDVGTYTFSVMDGAGAVSEVHARYTFVYTYRDGDWRIAHHHSSAMPEPAVDAPAPPATPAAPRVAAGGKPSKPGKSEPSGKAAKSVAADKEPEDAPPPELSASQMFLNAAASPAVGEFYPPESRVARETGAVALRVCAGPDGVLVGEPAIVQSSGSERLDGAARSWAKAARWVPATSNRRAVEGCTEVTARFERQASSASR